MAHVTLYRKYRPQTFADIVNQDHIKSTIEQEIKSGQLPHAFLFYGPRGVGKTTTARVLAKALNCSGRDAKSADPCNKCESCVAMTKGASFNLVEVDAASQTGVDNVRENIIANARVAVKSDEYKVFIIDEVHMLSTSSFNALLKTLEEPPVRVLFILATTEIHKIPETIISRCQRFDFHTIQAGVLKDYLGEIVKKEKREVDEDVLAAIVRKSGGYLRDALSVLGQVLTLPGKITAESAQLILPVSNNEDIIHFFELVSSADAAGAMKFIAAQELRGYRPYHFAGELIEFARKLLLKVVGSHPDIFVDEVVGELVGRVDALAGLYNPGQLLNLIDVLMKRRVELKQFEQGSLPLELAVIELTGGAVAPTPVAVQPATPQEVVPPLAVVSDDEPAAVGPASRPAPVEPVAETPEPVVPTKAAEQKKTPQKVEEAPEPAPVVDGNIVVATYAELNPVWEKIIAGVNDQHHSLAIVLKTATLRSTSDGACELAFQFKMHHDHVKRSMAAIVVEANNHLPGKAIKLKMVLDSELESNAANEVVEPAPEEKEAIGDDLAQLAKAFGGSVVE